MAADGELGTADAGAKRKMSEAIEEVVGEERLRVLDELLGL